MSDPRHSPTRADTESRAARRARSREAILTAAAEILNAEDADAFTARGVAESAGVSAGLVMQHFVSMADLALEVFVMANDELTARIAEATAGRGSWRDHVFEVFRALAERDLSRPALTRRIMAYAWTWSARQEAHFQTSVQHVFDTMLDLFADDLPAASLEQRRAAAAALVLIYNGFLRTAVSAGQDLETAMARMTAPMTMVLDGLEAAAAQPA